MTDVSAASPARSRVSILGIPVDRVTMSETLDTIEQYVASGKPHLVVTADACGIAQAQNDPVLKEIYLTADLVTPDSVGVLWAAKRQEEPIGARVSGVDILDQVCALSARKGYRIYFLGAAPGVAELAEERMRLRHPGCNIVGSRHGYFPPESDSVVAQEVARAKPDILFVAMGIPRQEKFIQANIAEIGAKVGIGVGGSFDVFSGRIKRAPAFVRAVHMEWFWRTVSNPKKFSKAKHLPKFVTHVLRSPRR